MIPRPFEDMKPGGPLGLLWPIPRRLLRASILGLSRLLFGLRIEGLRHLPRRGPVLVIANHLHNLDPILVAAASPRPLHFMAKKELYGVPVLGGLLRLSGSFPVDRGRADRAALRTAEERLTRGIAVGLFPEGTRSVTGALAPALAGAGLLALRSQAPVVPVAIVGTEGLPLNGAKGNATRGNRGPAAIRFGPPFTIPRQRGARQVSADEATAEIMAAIAAMLPPSYRGAYASNAAEEAVGSE